MNRISINEQATKNIVFVKLQRINTHISMRLGRNQIEFFLWLICISMAVNKALQKSDRKKKFYVARKRIHVKKKKNYINKLFFNSNEN